MRRGDALKEANITHVLSVLRMSPNERLFGPYQHMCIEVDDVEDENLLQHFATSNAFIQDGLDRQGGVLVHCAMGKSRSAACVVAYLMQKHHLSPQEALSQIRRGRPLCEPNEGFMKQLEVYYEMSCDNRIEENPIYQRWVYKQQVNMSIACGRPPDSVRFEDEQGGAAAGGDASGEGKDCPRISIQMATGTKSRVTSRRTLATSQYVVQHTHRDSDRIQQIEVQNPSFSPPCAHYFLDPLSWMRPELEHGKMDGRFECPKCRTNVGKYAWQGMACSCGDWVVPGISIAKGRVDEVKSRPSQGDTRNVASESEGAAAGPASRKGIL
ncbi:MAG: tyrosine protein phosphatase yvh1 [Sclerophora amabilis]|nr:MAG: tyrosine protein phosphatase yvh1 [Sclerophora amabilis]